MSTNNTPEWSPEHLAALVNDKTLTSDKLSLKGGRIEIQRTLFNGEPCIEKLYRGNLTNMQQREAARHGQHLTRRRDRVVGVAAAVGQRADLVTDLPLGHALAERDDAPGDLQTQVR